MKIKILELKISEERNKNGLFNISGVCLDHEGNKMSFECYSKDSTGCINIMSNTEGNIVTDLNLEINNNQLIEFTYLKPVIHLFK